MYPPNFCALLSGRRASVPCEERLSGHLILYCLTFCVPHVPGHVPPQQLPASDDPKSFDPRDPDSFESLEAFDPFALELFLSFVEALFSW